MKELEVEVPAILERLERVLEELGQVAVAVSGGVDSMTLAQAAHRSLGERCEVFHAVSPAVPGEATERVRHRAGLEGWRLTVLDAGEMTDPDYRRNPVDRCYFCKARLYDALQHHSDGVLVSGTNLDDLGDYRPGLEAARQREVRHPFVEARIDKSMVRALARHLGLGSLSELPASPCLSSRIETGIAIEASDLDLVHAIERRVRETLDATTVRCRLRRQGLVVEIDDEAYSCLADTEWASLHRSLASLVSDRGLDHEIELAPYRRGSAFLHPTPRSERRDVDLVTL